MSSSPRKLQGESFGLEASIDTGRAVKAANRRFYDAVARSYEELDGRRSTSLETWLRGQLSALRAVAPGPRLLDLGTGSGLVPRCAEGLFAPRVGLDLSPGILSVHREAFDLGVAADVDHLPFAAGSFDAVTCFAVLHHLPGFEGMVAEVARVLAPGGVLYTDHDMDGRFYRRFRLPLALHRRLHDAESRYRRAGLGITGELYHLSEWQDRGIDGAALFRACRQAGLRVTARFHWFGLSPLTDRLFGRRYMGRGWAPLLSLVASKEAENPAPLSRRVD